MPKKNYSVCSLEPELIKEYKSFAKKNFYTSGYQFNQSYLNYLYLENQYSKGFNDCRVITKDVAGDVTVVGCIHNMRSVLSDPDCDDKVIHFSAIHNLMIDKDNLGIGYMLLSDVIKKHKNFFVPGVSGELNNFYLKVGAKQLFNKWYRKFIIPNFYQLFQRLRRKKISPTLIKKLETKYLPDGVYLHYQSSNNIEKIIKNELESTFTFKLSLNYILWRLFGSNNVDKQTLVLTKDQDFAVFSIGCRKNIPILRLIYINHRVSINSNILIKTLIKLARGLGIISIFHVSDNLAIIDELRLQNFYEIKNPPKSYFYSKETPDFYSPHWPLMGDYGLDEFS